MDDIEAATAAVADVLAGKTFIAGDKTLKTGTMPTVAIVAANDDYPAGYHAGNAGGLDAIDTDLAPANIKSGVTIFGKVGTLTLAEDVLGTNFSSLTTNTTASVYKKEKSISGGYSYDLCYKSFNCDPSSMAVGSGFIHGRPQAGGTSYLQLYLGDVLVASTVIADGGCEIYGVIATRAVSGYTRCWLKLYNSAGSTRWYRFFARASGDHIATALAVGGVKIT